MVDDRTSFELSARKAIAVAFAFGILLGLSAGGLGALALQDTATDTSTAPTDGPEKEGTGSTSGDTESQKDTVSVAKLGLENEPVLGSENAEVTLVYWGDFNCMYCYRFAQQTFPDIRQDFVQPGDVKVVYKNLITMGPDSVTLGKASQTAWEMVGEENPEVYWEWHEQLSADQETRKSNSKPVKEDIADTTRKVDGIDAEELLANMKNASDEEIQEDIAEAKQRGVTGTPGFVVFRTDSDQAVTIEGAQPYTVFRSEITRLLEN